MLAVQIVLAAAIGYLIGSVPSSYLLVKARRGIDLREHGTGNIGISNAVQQAGAWVILPLVGFDVFVKGWLPIFLASGVVLGLGVPTQVAIGAGVIIGHNWPAYLRFQGGRGLAPSIGVLLALHWPLLLAFGAVALAIWFPTRNSPVAWFVATISVPVFAALMLLIPEGYAMFRPSPGVAAFGVTYVFLVLLRRLLGNWPGEQPSLPGGSTWARVAVNRLILDRDTASRDVWVRRRPGRVTNSPRGMDAE